jgi:citrate lyase beta subunit
MARALFEELQRPVHRCPTEMPADKDEAPLTAPWPGVQIYHPVVSIVGSSPEAADMRRAGVRLRAALATCAAHTLVLDLEDGCRFKEASRVVLADVMHQCPPRAGLQRAVRINPVDTPEHARDLALLSDIAPFVDVVMLAKAGDTGDPGEVAHVASELARIDARLSLQPVIEHPRALKAAESIVRCPSVRHVVFGLHDFSRAMGMSLAGSGWPSQVQGYLHALLIEARLAGCGVVAGVDTEIGQAVLPPQCQERDDIARWLERTQDAAASVVYRHALDDARMGFTGKQVIHPSHVAIVAAGLAPTPGELAAQITMLRFAMDGGILSGGALKFEGRMIDRPMIEKGLQMLLRADALGVLSREDRRFCRALAARQPPASLRDNWPYGQLALETSA